MTAPDFAAVHRRCERCADHPVGQHCWMLISREPARGPYLACRHCPATAAVCRACDAGGLVLDARGKVVDCPACGGWGATGVVVPGGGPG